MITNNEIIEMLKAGKTQREIAKAMGVSPSTICIKIKKIDIRIVKEAREEAKDKVKEAKDKVKEKETQQIIEMLKAGKTQREIAQIMGVSLMTICRKIKKIDIRIIKEAKEEARDKVKEAREEARDKAKQAKKEAKEKAKEEAKQATNEEKEKKKQEETQQIIEMLKAGKTQREIAQIMGISESTICKKIKKIDIRTIKEARDKAKEAKEEVRDKAKEAKEEAKEKETQQIIELLKVGKTQKEIAQIMEVSQSTICRKIKKIDIRTIKQATKEGKTQKEIAQAMGVSQSTIYKTIKNIDIKSITYEHMKQKLMEHTISKQEIDDYRRYIDNKYNKVKLKEVILMANMYIKTKRTNDAIKFLNTLIENEDMEYLGKERLIEAKNETERIKKIQQARSLLKQNVNPEEIAKSTGLSEIEVIRISNELKRDTERT